MPVRLLKCFEKFEGELNPVSTATIPIFLPYIKSFLALCILIRFINLIGLFPVCCVKYLQKWYLLMLALLASSSRYNFLEIFSSIYSIIF